MAPTTAPTGPSAGELPKEEIQAGPFVRANPLCDGRGIIVGVFDTGVDPGAPGLQTTTDGKPKILDLVDCSGSGDVDTSHTAAPSADGTLTGLTGRALSLPASWPPAVDGKYRLGVKAAFELYPTALVGRVKEERRARFCEETRGALVKARAELAAADAAALAAPAPAAGSAAAASARRAADELRARVALLDKAEKGWVDPGPLYDVLAFRVADGDSLSWRVCVDTSESGALGGCRLLAPFRKRREFATLDATSNLNYSVDVLGEGALVSVCVDAGAHGTHVAGIIGAHFPSRPELNGVAPGCQLIGFKIGDTRLGSMETGAALVRALGAALARGCHVVNLSYGEYASVDDAGRFATMAARAVHDHGLVFVTSAGNNGPALTTGGAPGTAEAGIAVGAFASAGMGEPQYSLRARLPDLQYTWSSRGPTADGALNVSISAPGGAIAPVPTWTLQGRQLMNGTSMAAPNATGGIALLLSAMAARAQRWSPALVRRAVEATAAQAANATGGGLERWALGRGLLQVEAADEWLRTHGRAPTAAVRFAVRVSVHGAATASAADGSHFAHSLNRGGRGVYLREPCHAGGADAVADVFVTPVLPHGAPAADKVALDLAIRLEPSAEWVACAARLALMHGGKGFALKLALAGLPAGASYAEVCGYDAEAPAAAGPLFVVPITVVRPHADLRAAGSPSALAFASCAFAPGHIERWWVVPPEGATWATVRVRARPAKGADGGAGPRLFMLHATQLLPQRALNTTDCVARATLALADAGAAGAPAELVKTMAVVGGVTLELALAQFWSALGDADVSVDVAFFGLVAEPSAVCLDARELWRRTAVRAPFRAQTLEPEGTLTALRKAVRPTAYRLNPPPAAAADGAPGRGDVWPPPPRAADADADAAAAAAAPAAPAADGAVAAVAADGRASYAGYELVLSYKFALKEGSEALTVRFPSLQASLYDSPYEAQLHALLDGNRQLLRVGDYYAKTGKATAGAHEVRLVVRHDSVAFLERLLQLPCVLEFKLGAPIKLEFATSRAAALKDPQLGARGAVRLALEAGARVELFVLTPPQPDLAEPGDVLVGSLNYGASSTEAGSAKRPGGWPVSMVCVGPPLKELPREGAPPPPAPPAADDSTHAAFAAAARELRLSQLSKLSARAKEDKAAAAATLATRTTAAASAPAAAADAPAPAPAAGASAAERYAALLADLRAESAAAAPPAAPLLPLLAAHLAHCEAMAARADGGALRAIVQAAVDVVAAIDATQMAAALGVGADADDSALTKAKENAEADKKALVAALRAKALALADLHALGADASVLEQLDSTMSALHRWAAPADHAKLAAAWHGAHGRHALALQALDEALAKEKGLLPKAEQEARLPLLRALGWAFLAESASVQLLRSFPKAYPPGF